MGRLQNLALQTSTLAPALSGLRSSAVDHEILKPLGEKVGKARLLGNRGALNNPTVAWHVDPMPCTPCTQIVSLSDASFEMPPKRLRLRGKTRPFSEFVG